MPATGVITGSTADQPTVTNLTSGYDYSFTWPASAESMMALSNPGTSEKMKG